jgi:hypothetical protein
MTLPLYRVVIYGIGSYTPLDNLYPTFGEAAREAMFVDELGGDAWVQEIRVEPPLHLDVVPHGAGLAVARG